MIDHNDSNHVVLSYLDSLKQKYSSQKGNSKAVQWNDSVAHAEDSIRRNTKKTPLEAPVEYTAKDSLVFYMGSKNAYLYGNSNVKYTNIELTAENITMNMDSSTGRYRRSIAAPKAQGTFSLRMRSRLRDSQWR